MSFLSQIDKSWTIPKGGKTIHTFRSKKPRLCRRGSHGSSGAGKSYLCLEKGRKEDSEGENRENDFHGELDRSLSLSLCH